jgi:hypothetical protein
MTFVFAFSLFREEKLIDKEHRLIKIAKKYVQIISKEVNEMEECFSTFDHILALFRAFPEDERNKALCPDIPPSLLAHIKCHLDQIGLQSCAKRGRQNVTYEGFPSSDLNWLIAKVIFIYQLTAFIFLSISSECNTDLCQKMEISSGTTLKWAYATHRGLIDVTASEYCLLSIEKFRSQVRSFYVISIS